MPVLTFPPTHTHTHARTHARTPRSSVIASNIVGLCRGYAKQLINDCGVVIQGECPGELPECMLACVSLNHIDVNIRKKLDFE